MSSRSIALLLTAVLLACTEKSAESFDEITWQGEKYKLARSFKDWEDYKKSEEQLSPTEAKRVYEKLVGIAVPSRFTSHGEFVEKMPKVNFPGYGYGYDGSVTGLQGERYTLNEYDIPLARKRRALLYRWDKDGSLTLVMDQVFEELASERTPEYSVKRKTVVEEGMLRVYVSGKIHREAKLNRAV